MSRQHNYLAAMPGIKGSGDMALAWADISSGDLAVMASARTPCRRSGAAGAARNHLGRIAAVDEPFASLVWRSNPAPR